MPKTEAAASTGDEANRIVAEADAQLAREEPGPFTQAAWVAIRSRVAEYVHDLIQESARASRRSRNGESITSVDVHAAGRALAATSTSRVGKSLGVVGGLLAGGALGNFFQFLYSPEAVHSEAMAVSGVVLAVGISLVVWDLARNP